MSFSFVEACLPEAARPSLALECQSMSFKRQFARCHVLPFSQEFSSGYRIEPHSHDCHQLIYASSGVMTVETDAGAWVVPPHRAVWVPVGVEHAIVMSGRVAMKTLYVRKDVRHSLPRTCFVLGAPPLLREIVLHVVERGGLRKGVV